jgi:hypothetical protein
MSDLFQYYGNDISLSSSGDILPVSGTVQGQQRILRRLLTNPGEYIWHPEYGAGLPAWVGENLDIPKLTGIIKGQMLLESVVAPFPAPVVQISEIPFGITCNIQYNDSVTQQPVTLSFNVNQ